MAGEETSRELAPDIIVEIIVRLPPSSRRRCRFVCRSWRELVDTRTTEMQSRAKPLVATTGIAYVVDDLLAGRRSLLWKGHPSRPEEGISVVGTCNGLICLCDNRESGGAITLINPVTDEKLSIPHLPCAPGLPPSHETYSFGYHPTTGRYKVVHVRCYYHNVRAFPTVQVFTLGESSWRGVATPPADLCNPSAGVVCVDGATYWVVRYGTKKIMSFDLGNECVTAIQSIPAVPSESSDWHLTEVHGKLGVAFSVLDKTEVWALEGVTTGQHRWSCKYILQLNRPLTRPHFAHGEHLLTGGVNWYGSQIYTVYKHSPSENTRKRRRDVVEISEERDGKMIACTIKSGRSWDRRTFSYVGTTEPLGAYMRSSQS